MADHLSMLEASKKEESELEINDTFPDEHLLAATLDLTLCIVDYSDFLVSNFIHEGITY